MKRINQLPENLINQIAAGEVIERPAAAVKELVENSIDAGATKIEVEVSNGCRDLRIADNGHGIHKDDLQLAFSRHATSKISTCNDLFNIHTLGFRGEALSSIISVSKTMCLSRTTDSECGYKVECRDSQIKISETGCSFGTVMEIKDLFYNTPARLKFLKQPQTELSAITEILQNIALSYPEVAITLIHKKHPVLKTSGSGEIAFVAGEIYSKDLLNELAKVYFSDKASDLSIKGLVSNPDYTRNNKKAIHTFVNGRTVRCPIILKAIDTAYKDLIPNGKFPFSVLNMTMPASEVDVNVHPSKKEIKYSKPNLIFNFVYTAIRAAFEGNKYPKDLHIVEEKTSYMPASPYLAENSFSEDIFNSFKNTSENSKKDGKITSFSDFMLAKESLQKDDIIQIDAPPISCMAKTSTLPEEGQKTLFNTNFTIAGQLHNTYILVETREGLQIIDQHIAHERYLYEKLKTQTVQASQLLLTPLAIDADEEEISLLEENIELLQKYGFGVVISEQVQEDNNTYRAAKLTKIPQTLSDKDYSEITTALMQAVKTTPENLENEILETIACKASVKAGEKLSHDQMLELVEKWSETKFNKTCPHGRKIAHTIPIKDIAKFFGRLQ